MLIEMLFQLWQEFRQNFVVMAKKPHKLRKSHDVKAVHGKFPIGHESVKRPKCFFLVQVEKQNTNNRRHALTVADFHVIHAVG